MISSFYACLYFVCSTEIYKIDLAKKLKRNTIVINI